MVDTTGLVWGLAITPADVADSKGARLAVTDAMCVSRRLVKIWADSAYQGFIEFALLLLGLIVTIVKRRKGSKGFPVQPRRWVVERTFGWLTRWRRLNRNYEHTPKTAARSDKWPESGLWLAASLKRINNRFPNRL